MAERGMPTVVFVTGPARSGSTLVSEILGAQDAVLNAGELSLIWRDLLRDNTCACGLLIRDCGLWGPVTRDVASKLCLDDCALRRTAAARHKLGRSRYVPVLLVLLLLSRMGLRSRVLRQLAGIYLGLLDGAANKSECSVVVDSSKTLGSYLLWRAYGIRPKVVFVSRDAVATVGSTVRSKSIKRGNDESLPPGGSLSVGVWRWNTAVVLGQFVSRLSGTASSVRYEDLVEDPESIVTGLCAALGIGFSRDSISGRLVQLKSVSHAAVGNPRRGGVSFEITSDDRWHQILTRRERRWVAMTTYPVEKAFRGRSTVL